MEVDCDVLRVCVKRKNTCTATHTHAHHSHTRRFGANEWVNLFDVYFGNKFELPGFDLSVGRSVGRSAIGKYGANEKQEKIKPQRMEGIKRTNETFVY